MAPKGGTFFFLLLVACAALAMPPDGRPENKRDFKDMARKLMRKCQTKGYPAPEMIQLKTVFNNSDLPVADRKSKQSGTLLPTFLNVLHSVSTDKEMTTKTWNFRNLPTMLRLMRNSSVASACYMQAFLAPLCWETLTTRSENNMTSDEYDTLLSAAKPALWNMPLNLPSDVGRRQNLKKMMKVLKEVYDAKSRGQRTQVVRWVKEQITRKYFNCTMRPPSDPRSMLMKSCKPSLEWLNLEALTMMGPYVSRLATRDVDSSPKEQLCDFFRSAQFKSATINPSLGKKFLQKFQECFRGKKEFAENVDKLGILACHYSAAPDLTPDISRKLLFQLKCCDDFRYPYMRQLKKRLVRSVMSNTNSTEALGKLGTSVALLSPKQLFEIPDDPFKEFLKDMGSTVQWTRGQLRTLSKKLLCNNVSLHDCWKSGAPMRSLPQYLQPVAGGLPSSVLKRVKNIVLDKEGLNNMCMQMTKGQLTAMLQGPLGQMAPSELVQKSSGRLLRRLSLNKLDKANTSLDQMMYTNWSLPQAALNAKKMHDGKKFPWIGRDRKLHSVFQGVTAEMIDDVADNEMQDIVQAIAETPQWLSKVQAGRLARKLFATKEKERTDYFKTITVEEMNNIPTCLLLRLPPGKVGDLPDSVCPVLLEKIEEANLSSLPHRSPSRPAFTQRALLCLAEGRDLSGLTNDTVSMLGPLLCELQPSQLLQMAPDVLNFSLQEMASCQHIPQRHRADIIQLVTKTFGDPSNWTAETMETLGPLLLLDDNATSALPYKPWMKDVLYSLKSGMHHPSNALRKKIFDLTTTTPNAASKSNDDEVTVALIEELEMNNVYWKPTQLAQMSNKVFLATLETLGAVSDYGADQLVVLSKKATEVFGPVSQMTESVVIQLGCIIRGFSNADLEKLPISLDTLEEIAKCGWNESQMEAVWKGVASYSNLKVQQLDAADMVALSQFICGLNPSEFGQLDVNAFKDAVGSMDGVQCSYKVAQQLKNLAVSAFGKPNTWTEAQVSELGNVIAGLDPTELASLDPAVFSFISKSCIPHMLHFAVLSVNQLTALGPDNAAMVTSEQRSSLSDEQLATLKSALTGSPDQTQRSTQSGTPSLNVEGISALMKPFLALLMGFLLL